VSHTGATDCLDEALYDDTLFDVQREFAGTLLRCTPTHTVGIARNVFDFLGLNPLTLFRDWSRAVVGTLFDNAHVVNFLRINNHIRYKLNM
jgi:hypothetical protein